MGIKYYVTECYHPQNDTASFKVVYETNDVKSAFVKMELHEKTFSPIEADDRTCYIEVVRDEQN